MIMTVSLAQQSLVSRFDANNLVVRLFCVRQDRLPCTWLAGLP